MSILLDALKKSEEQRQLGQAPNIHSPGGETRRQDDGGNQWLGLGLMGLAAVAMAWIGWQQLREPEELANEPVIAQIEHAPTAIGADDGQAAGQDSGAAPSSASDSGGTAPATGVRRPQMISSGASRTRVESYQPDTERPKGETVAPPDDVQDSERQRAELSRSFRDFNARKSAASGAATKPPPTTNPQVAQRSAPMSEPAPTSEPAPERNVDTPAETQQQADRASAAEPISFWELPQGIRDALPELRITVLVYAERPEDRFVLIGGQRVVEKDRLDDGVQLAEIRRDGAVFEYRNYRFLVEG